MTSSLTRCHTLRVGAFNERCDGCGIVIPAHSYAEYRLDGAVFCGLGCANTHHGIPLEHRATPLSEH